MASVSSSMLKEEFNSPSQVSTRLHYMMARHEGESDPDKLQKMVQIALRVGASLEQQAGSGKWTPLDVAVISGFRLGVEHLLEKGARPSQNTFRLAEECNPTLDPILKGSKRADLAPRIVSDESGKIFGEALSIAAGRSDGKVHLVPSRPFTDKAPDDFGMIIKKLLLSRNQTQEMIDKCESPQVAPDIQLDSLIRDMKMLAHLLGFEIELTGTPYYPRDHLFVGFEGALMGGVSGLSGEGATQKDITNAIEKGVSLTIQKELCASSLTNHYSFGGILGSTLLSAPSAIHDYQKRTGSNRLEGRLYIEGGNMYTVSNAKGDKVVLVGASLEGINLALGHIGKIVQENLDLYARRGEKVQFPSRFTNREIFNLVFEKFALGRIAIGGKKGVLTRDMMGNLVDLMNRKDGPSGLKALASSEQVIPSLPFGPNDNLQKYAKSVGRFAYEKNFIHDLFDMTLGIEPGSIHFIPEAAYHLDTFMHPGPKGTMLVQSYSMVLEFVQTIESHADHFKLTEADKKILGRYRETAIQLEKDLGPLLKDVSQKLERAGITPIPIPAVFYDASLERLKQPTFHVNFINGLSGFSPKTKRFYFITTGAQVGDKLGGVLMDLFAWYLQELETKLDVFFVGRDPKNPDDFSEVMHFWNKLGGLPSQSGLHCFSVPLETAPHKQK